MDINNYIDHTLLKSDASREEIEDICDEAMAYKFKAVCVNSSWTSLVFEKLKYVDVEVCTVVGFPLGAMSKEAKIFEAKDAIKNGASEIDMVLNIGKLKDKEYEYVEDEIRKVKEVIGKDTILKVIIETSLLDDEEKKIACEIIENAGADFVKTSTGFSTSGAKVEDIKLIREEVKDRLKIKASGGIKTYEEAVEMINAGANRIGTSNGVKIIKNNK
ncbi:MAG: deoxyribose-phosphate aldolase [Tissierellia bacterium]|nr:deoxyribose-phosphate aldolase [Tissierellia bacterium]